jgi:hypothetical protein
LIKVCRYKWFTGFWLAGHRSQVAGSTSHVDGETASLNQMLVREGFALNFQPAAKGRFKADEAAAPREPGTVCQA